MIRWQFLNRFFLCCTSFCSSFRTAFSALVRTCLTWNLSMTCSTFGEFSSNAVPYVFDMSLDTGVIFSAFPPWAFSFWPNRAIVSFSRTSWTPTTQRPTASIVLRYSRLSLFFEFRKAGLSGIVCISGGWILGRGSNELKKARRPPAFAFEMGGAVEESRMFLHGSKQNSGTMFRRGTQDSFCRCAGRYAKGKRGARERRRMQK